MWQGAAEEEVPREGLQRRLSSPPTLCAARTARFEVCLKHRFGPDHSCQGRLRQTLLRDQQQQHGCHVGEQQPVRGEALGKLHKAQSPAWGLLALPKALLLLLLLLLLGQGQGQGQRQLPVVLLDTALLRLPVPGLPPVYQGRSGLRVEGPGEGAGSRGARSTRPRAL